MDLMFLKKAFEASGTGSGLMFLNLVGRYAAAGRAVHGERKRLNLPTLIMLPASYYLLEQPNQMLHVADVG